MEEMQCYCWQKFGHYARECYFNKESDGSDKEEQQFTHEGNNHYEEVILMTNTHLAQDTTNVWYLDTRCGNHISGNKVWFIKLDKLV